MRRYEMENAMCEITKMMSKKRMNIQRVKALCKPHAEGNKGNDSEPGMTSSRL